MALLIISMQTVFEFVVILLFYANSCSGGSYGDRTTPEEGPTTLKPTICEACDVSHLECRNDLFESKNPFSLFPSFPNPKTTFFFPKFHNFKGPEPIEVYADGSAVFQSNIPAARGKWLKKTTCPSGMYVMGVQFFNRNTDAFKKLSYVQYLCRTPGGSEMNTFLEATPFSGRSAIEKNSGKWSMVCAGSIVGFNLKYTSLVSNDLESYCSDKNARRNESLVGKASLGQHSTTSVYCQKYQAMCGMEAQVVKDESFQNLRIKCCAVPDPNENCVPTEEQLLIRSCDNSKSAEGLQCDFVSKIGLSFDFQNEVEEKQLIFYTSIGYDFHSIHKLMKEKIISKLKLETSLKYSWDDISCNVEQFEKTSMEVKCMKPYESLEIYQIVGKCGNFMVRTNRFIKVTEKGGIKSEEPWDV